MPFPELAGDSLALVAPLARAVEPWQLLYADHTSVSTTVLFLHLASLVGSAGVAVTNDRLILATPPDDATTRASTLLQLARAHRTVLVALAISFASGVLLLLADVEAFVVMPAFWTKVALILLLFANASMMMRTETRVQAAASGAAPVPASAEPPGAPLVTPATLWRRLRRHAATSLVLWFAIVLAGTAMTN